MKNGERLQILKMVQEGRISPEEATKLLDALDQPESRGTGPKPTQVRVLLKEDGRTHTFSVGIGLARWVLNQNWITVDFGGSVEENRRLIFEAIEHGSVGRVLEVAEGNKRLEVWLEA